MDKSIHTGRCHCGAVQLQVPSAPDHLTNCNCSICWRYGALWAYFLAPSVTIECAPGAMQHYSWGIEELRFFRCARCGVVTHWEKTIQSDSGVIGVNMRNFDLAALAHAEVIAVNGRLRGRSHFRA